MKLKTVSSVSLTKAEVLDALSDTIKKKYRYIYSADKKPVSSISHFFEDCQGITVVYKIEVDDETDEATVIDKAPAVEPKADSDSDSDSISLPPNHD